MTKGDSLEVAGWRMAAGSLPFEDLPGIAVAALESGFNSPSLCLLAGQPWFFFDESVELFRAALEELDIELLDADSARWRLARRTAEDMVAGRIEAADGADELCAVEREVRDNGDLLIFVGLASELDDHPEDAQLIAGQMVAAARELLARPAPRRWIRLMASLGRSPLTQSTGSGHVEVDAGTLPLSDGLRRDLARWDADFASILARRPASGGFDSEYGTERFVAAGRELMARLQRELGPSYRLEYRPEPVRPPGARLRGW